MRYKKTAPLGAGNEVLPKSPLAIKSLKTKLHRKYKHQFSIHQNYGQKMTKEQYQKVVSEK